MKLSEGTISVLFGIHAPVHSILVLISWIKLYQKFPKLWEVCCIFLHDIGHIGLNYLSDKKQKDKHTVLGAKIARTLFGQKRYDLVIDHDYNRNNRLYKPDKYSWYIAPRWWLYSNTIIEPKVKVGLSINESVRKWREVVKRSIESGEFKNSHDMFLDRLKADRPIT